jgi:hypothetical protein
VTTAALRPTQRFHKQVKAGTKSARKLKAILDGVGVTVRLYPTVRAPVVGETMAIGTIRRLWGEHGTDVLVLSLRCIVESRGGNAGEIRAETLSAIAALLSRYPKWRGAGLKLLEAFDDIDLGEVRREAKDMAQGSTVQVLVGLLTAELSARLGPGR